MSKKKQSPWATAEERAAVVVPDTRTPAEKRLHQLIEAESVPELCGSDYSQALYKAALKMATNPVVPDAMTSADIQEHIEYVAGWNDCRQAMLKASLL